jgi:hypothetical protein
MASSVKVFHKKNKEDKMRILQNYTRLSQFVPRENIILKQILKKQGFTARTGLNWLTVGSTGGLLQTR